MDVKVDTEQDNGTKKCDKKLEMVAAERKKNSRITVGDKLNE